MNIAFKIPPVAQNYSDLHLLAETGHNEISFLVYEKKPFSLQGFYMYSLNRHITPVDYAAALERTLQKEDVLHQKFASCTICSNHTESGLIPSEYFDEREKEKYANLLFGEDKRAVFFKDDVKGQYIKNVYRIPAIVFGILNRFFPDNKITHSTTLQLNCSKAFGEVLNCVVYHNGIKVFLFIESKIQIVQYFEYQSPVDVCYHLLNICERFYISPDSVQLQLSGIVEEHSDLYRNLFNYFLNISFAPLPEGSTLSHPLQVHPHQFYSNLSALAACVS